MFGTGENANQQLGRNWSSFPKQSILRCECDLAVSGNMRAGRYSTGYIEILKTGNGDVRVHCENDKHQSFDNSVKGLRIPARSSITNNNGELNKKILYSVSAGDKGATMKLAIGDAAKLHEVLVKHQNGQAVGTHSAPLSATSSGIKRQHHGESASQVKRPRVYTAMEAAASIVGDPDDVPENEIAVHKNPVAVSVASLKLPRSPCNGSSSTTGRIQSHARHGGQTDKENTGARCQRSPATAAVFSPRTQSTQQARQTPHSQSSSTFYSKSPPSQAIWDNHLSGPLGGRNLSTPSRTHERPTSPNRVPNQTRRRLLTLSTESNNSNVWFNNRDYGNRPAATPQKSLPLQGFFNLGNTCYMNAILQALFGIDCFANELWTCFDALKSVLAQTHTNTLLSSLVQLLKNRDNTSLDLKVSLLTHLKSVISVKATRFSGHSQHDAHEFLSQVLDQLKEEINQLAESDLLQRLKSNPVVSNFEFLICHTVRCLSCAREIRREEKYNDLSLDLPITSCSEDEQPLSVQELLDAFLQREEVRYKCDECHAEASELSHKFQRLPRVLVLHLKRYSYDSEQLKMETDVRIPKFLTLAHLCAGARQPELSATQSRENSDDVSGEEQRQLNEALQLSMRDGLPQEQSSDHFDADMRRALELSRIDACPDAFEKAALITGFEVGDLNTMRISDAENESSGSPVPPLSHGMWFRDEVDPDTRQQIRSNCETGLLPDSFQLVSIVSHLGTTSTSGHYVTDVIDTKSKTWHSYSDCTVTETSEESVRKERQSSGYIFFYVAK